MKMAEKAVEVSFVCQRCLMPIQLDSSFAMIDEHTLAELRLHLYTPPPLNFSSGHLDRIVPSLTDPENNDFTIVNNIDNSASSDKSSSAKAANQYRVNAELFEVLSNNTEIDHPLCDECCDTLMTLLDSELNVVSQDCNQYSEFLKTLVDEPNEVEIKKLEQELNDLELEERKLKSELSSLKVKEEQAAAFLQQRKSEQESSKKQEEKFFEEYCKYKRQLLEVEDQNESLDNEISFVEAQLERLEKTNALNATFHIWYNGHFGTMNTFRLGRLPSEPVDWNEINASWGQTALLLNSLARKINFKFAKYQIIPFGNNSYIKVLEDNSELPLYSTGGFKFKWDTKFDQGMVAFLDCLNQLQTAMRQPSGQIGFALPYRMTEKGKIEDSANGKYYSIKIQLNSEENWTKALKFMLTNLKWALAWVSCQSITE